MKCKRTVCPNEADGCIHSDGTNRNYCIDCAILINKVNPEVPYLINIPKLPHWKCSTLDEQLTELFPRKDEYNFVDAVKEDRFLYAFVRGYAKW